MDLKCKTLKIILKKDEQSWRSHTFLFQTLLQTYSKQTVWSWGPEIESQIGLPEGSLLLSLPMSLPLSLWPLSLCLLW